MKWLVSALLILLMGLTLPLSARVSSPMMLNPTFSARQAGSTVYFQMDVDTVGAVAMTPNFVIAKLYWSINSGTSWDSTSLTSVGGAEINTWRGSFTCPSSNFIWRIYCKQDPTGVNPVALLTPIPNSAGTFPPPDNKFVLVSADDLNEQSNAEMDLAGLYVTYDPNTHIIYSKLTNRAGTWSTGNVFGGRSYSFGFNNSLTTNEDVNFAFTRVSVLFSTGMFRQGPESSIGGIHNIGSVQENIGAALNLAGDLDVAIGDAYFGPFTYTGGREYLGISGITVALPAGTVVDTVRCGGHFYPMDAPTVAITGNTAPTLSNLSMTPWAFRRPESPLYEYEVFITYTDADNNPAVVHTCIVNGGTPIVMTPDTPLDHTFTDGSRYTCDITGVGPGDMLDFNFTDGLLRAPWSPIAVGVDATAPGMGRYSGLISLSPNPADQNVAIRLATVNPNARLDVYDIRGSHVRSLGISGTGMHQSTWDRMSDSGEMLPAGIYRVVLRDGSQTSTRSIVLRR